MQEFDFTQLVPVFTLDQAGEYIALWVAGLLATICHQALEVGIELAHAAVTQFFLCRRETGLQSAQNGQGPAAQWAAIGMRNAQQIANDFDGDGTGKVFNQITAALGLQVI